MGKRIFLIGPMGAGKSAVGRHLAGSLHLDFHDSDTFLEQRTGVDIAFIFEKEGEAGFRKRERAAINELTRLDDIVLATGGGAVLDPKNRRRMGRRGYVVYLHATVEQQWQRVRHSQHRPLLQNDDPRAVLQSLFEIRDPLYRSIADLVVSTNGERVPAVSAKIRERLVAQPNW